MSPFNKLPNEIRFILRNYLKESDNLALALSEAHSSFSEMFWCNRSTLSLSHCTYLTSYLLRRFHYQPSFDPSKITRLNISHLYWLPAESLVDFVMKMTNVQELNIEDTKISLADMPTIFKSCKKISHLSFTLAEANLIPFQDGVMKKDSLGLLKEAFSQVKHLKIFTFAQLNGDPNFESWLVTLETLVWFKNCIDLVVDVAYDSSSPDRANAFTEQAFRDARSRLLPQLKWMQSSLSCVVFLRNGSLDRPRDRFTSKLVLWLLTPPTQVMPPPNPRERLWIHEIFSNLEQRLLPSNSGLTGQSVKSYCVSGEGTSQDTVAFDENNARFRHLEHLGGPLFFRRLEQLVNLKFLQGRYRIISTDDGPDQGLNEFCAVHPLLEVLLIKPDHLSCSQRKKCWCPFHKKNDILWSPNWSLMNLRILGNRCILPCSRFMDYVSVACPNIQVLHLGVKNGVCQMADFLQTRDFFSGISFEHLQVLTINGMYLFDGSYLPTIFQNCPKLERFHLGGTTSHTIHFRHLFRHLGECLPTSLRDLRIQWKNGIDDNAEVLALLRSILERSPRLERLVLYAVKTNHSSCDRRIIQDLQDYLVTFVKKMPKLVALCMSGFQFNDVTIESVKRQLIDQVLPERPSLWFHLDSNHPKENDRSVPWIHNAGIVNPIDWFDVPPTF